MSTQFSTEDPAHVFTVPLPSLVRMFCMFSRLFSPEMRDPLQLKYPEMYQTQISGKENQSKTLYPIR